MFVSNILNSIQIQRMKDKKRNRYYNFNRVFNLFIVMLYT